MPITTRKSAFVRYNVDEDVLSKLDTMHFEGKLREFAFKPIDEGTETKSTGWVSVDNINDTFETTTAAVGNFFLWGMRRDTRKVPGAVLRNEVSKAIAQELKRTGKDFISRERRVEIRDQSYLRLLARMPATPKVTQCVYDADRNVIYFGSSATEDMLSFEDLFFTTFGAVPTIPSPSDKAVAIMGDEVTSALSDMAAGSENGADYPLFCDFLLWLWYKTETHNGGEFTIPSGTYTALVKDRIGVVEFGQREVVSQMDTKTKDELNEFADVKYGLWKFQRSVYKLHLDVTRGSEEYSFDIDATKPNFFVVKTPPLHLNGESVTNESPFLEKMALLDVAQNFVDDMYTLFVKARLSKRWTNARKAIQVWLEASAPECERGYSDDNAPKVIDE